MNIDIALFRTLNGLAGRDAILDAVMVAGARYAVFGYVVLLAALWLRWRPHEQRVALLAGVSVLAALGIGQLLGMAMPHPRPFDTAGLGDVHLLVSHAPDSGFPSDHATLAFAVAASLWVYRRRVGFICFVFAIWIAVARVYVGVHFPSDVVGGAAVGSTVSAILLWFAGKPPLNAAIDSCFALLRRIRLAATS